MPCANCPNALPPPTEPEKALLAKLSTYAYLPVCRFLVRSPENPELSFVMSAPVYLEAEDSAPDAVKTWGEALLLLQKRGYITLDYGVPISGADYDLYRRSRHYQDFAFGCTLPSAEPYLEEGSVGLTLQGQEQADALDLL
ncbi:MAG: hypothetical protein LUD83_04830 [Clostridiales bacterium]|nr:hypothetical protein [Clostridiales bacterium]